MDIDIDGDELGRLVSDGDELGSDEDDEGKTLDDGTSDIEGDIVVVTEGIADGVDVGGGGDNVGD